LGQWVDNKILADRRNDVQMIQVAGGSTRLRPRCCPVSPVSLNRSFGGSPLGPDKVRDDCWRTRVEATDGMFGIADKLVNVGLVICSDNPSSSARRLERRALLGMKD